MRHLVKTNFEPLFKNLFENETLSRTDKNALPAVNIAENEKEYHLEFSLAGYQKEDLKVNLENDTLTVSASIEKESSKEDEDKTYTRKEYVAHSFSRSFYLPEKVKEKDIVAHFENGVLTLSLPKAAKAKAKTISIN